MSIQRATPVNEFFAKLIFLILPTAGIGYFLLDALNQYYTILQNSAYQQAIFLLAGMGLSALFHSFRFRFLPAYILLIIAFYSIYKGLDEFAVGEFDAFFIARRFQVFAILFSTGWLLGWGFTRLRYFSIFIAVTLLSTCILVIAKFKVDTFLHLVQSFSPAALFSVYIIFAAEQIYNYKDKSKKFWWFLIRRLGLFCMLAALLLAGSTFVMRAELKQAVANYGGGGGKSGNDSGMTHKNANGTTDLNDFQKLRSSQGRSKEFLFCAHINNYFPGTTVPNPLYLTSFYFTKFDTLTETFERDSSMPFNDLFLPNPSRLPLFATASDSNVIYNSLGEAYRDVVEVEIYSKQLDPETYLAPNAGFFVQPITVEKDFRQEFKSAFRAKSYSSLLNSAYFVYNINKPEIRKFQEMRNNILRKAPDYSKMDSAFMKYYTFMPSGNNFRKIADMAHKIMDTGQTTVDKVLALRDYFLSKDENGDPLYQYSDNPGEPDIPNASKLLYFLFENHKGYCAYYAGATLFMLRAMGIPSRIAVGFLTEDRSDKNKCWYWYYAKQAHAWVQVYFPGFGWLDFDTTVGNNEAHESPSPDGTPPMQPPKAWLSADGTVEDVDTLKKIVRMSVKQFVFHDKDYKLPVPVTLSMDVKIATFYRDSLSIGLAAIQKGDEGTAVSYAEAFKNLEATPIEPAQYLVKRFPSPAPVDEIYLKRKDVDQPKEIQKPVVQRHTTSARLLLLELAGGLAGLIILLLLLPEGILMYYVLRFRKSRPDSDQPYWAYMASTFCLHMVGITRKRNQTPMQYARQQVEPLLGRSFTDFMNIYLKKKYAKQTLTSQEMQAVSVFLPEFLALMKKQIRFKDRLFGFINPVSCANYYIGLDEDEQEAGV